MFRLHKKSKDTSHDKQPKVKSDKKSFLRKKSTEPKEHAKSSKHGLMAEKKDYKKLQNAAPVLPADEMQAFMEHIHLTPRMTAEQRIAFKAKIKENPAWLFNCVAELKDERRVFQNISPFEWLFWSNSGEHLRIFFDLMEKREILIEENEWLEAQLLSELDKCHGKNQAFQFMYDGKKTKSQFNNTNATLIDAMKLYCNNYDTWREVDKKAYWINTVGALQSMMDLHTALKLSQDDVAYQEQAHHSNMTSQAVCEMWSSPDLGKTHALVRELNGMQASELPSKEAVLRTLQMLETYEMEAKSFREFFLKEMTQVYVRNTLNTYF